MGGLVIAGERSGTGKTTITLALLAALVKQSLPVQSFKVGPDYIDPMFHRAVTGRPSYTLDPVLTSEGYVQSCYQQHAGPHMVVEGVMGLFDGADTESDYASTDHVARLLQLPVVLVVDCGRMSRSLAALVLGYRQLDPQVAIAGVVLNRVGSDRHLAFLRSALDSIDMPILGVFRREADIALPDRHLGLVPVGELTGFKAVQHRLAALGQQGFDWGELDKIFRASSPLQSRTVAAAANEGDGALPPTAIAVAYDRAFNFYYPNNLALLEQAGAQLHYWSPMTEPLPVGVRGLYLGGGFPEMFAETLAQNTAARHSVQRAIAHGLPTYAECGGLMYLCRTLTDFDGQAWPMVGALDAAVGMGGRLSLGYRQAIALAAGPLLPAGATVTGHEFHRSSLDSLPATMDAAAAGIPPASSLYQSQRAFGARKRQLEGMGSRSLHASYLHLHWGSRPDIPHRFLQQCRRWQAIG